MFSIEAGKASSLLSDGNCQLVPLGGRAAGRDGAAAVPVGLAKQQQNQWMPACRRSFSRRCLKLARRLHVNEPDTGGSCSICPNLRRFEMRKVQQGFTLIELMIVVAI
ncbi:MAG: prepilin-type N-terminal cleavage/methylation domain-containing protein, partial [Thiobacillus sp.]